MIYFNLNRNLYNPQKKQKIKEIASIESIKNDNEEDKSYINEYIINNNMQLSLKINEINNNYLKIQEECSKTISNIMKANNVMITIQGKIIKITSKMMNDYL